MKTYAICPLLALVCILPLISAHVVGQTSVNLGIFDGAGDVGTSARKGSVVFDPIRQEYRITGGGANMWGTRDDFFFVWKKLTGDLAITATVKIVSDGNNHRKAGLVLRQNLEPGSVYADAVVHGDGLTALQWREKTDEITRTIHFPINGPTRVRIERRKNRIILFAGKAGGPLMEMGDTELAPFTPVYAGLGVCAHDDKAEVTALFTDVTVEAVPSAPVPKK
jgi:TolB protein